MSAGLASRRAAVLGSAYRTFYRQPLEIVAGEGVRLVSAEGVSYLDAYNNVASVGHANPRVVDAITQQALRVNTHTRYLHPLIISYAERLLGHLPPHLESVMLTCTGSEANDLALRMATTWTQSTGVIVTQNAYHGVTAAVSAVSPSFGLPVSEHVRLVHPPRASEGQDGSARFARDVALAAEDLQRLGLGVAALIVDSVLSSDGVILEPAGFLAEAARVVDAYGGLVIADEVQAGFGRTGHFWGFERHGLAPDLVTLGKPMGNGHPVGGVVTRREIATMFGSATRYFNTFGGNPVSSAAALAVLDEIEERGLVEHAQHVGTRLKEELVKVVQGHPGVADLRGAGLFLGIEMVEGWGGRSASENAARTVESLVDSRILTGVTGVNGTVVKIRPPLVFDDANADELIAGLRVALAEA